MREKLENTVPNANAILPLLTEANTATTSIEHALEGFRYIYGLFHSKSMLREAFEKERKKQ